MKSPMRHFKLKARHAMPRAFTLMAAMTLTFACNGKKKSDENDAGQATSPAKNGPVTPRASVQGLLDISVRLGDEGLRLGIKNAPKGSSFECEIGTKALAPCYDNAVLPKPSQDRSYTITVDALVDGKRVATGTSPTFTVTNGTVGATSEDPTNPLSLRFADANVKFGMTAPKSKDFTVAFALVRPNACSHPEFRCRLDSATSPFWVACDNNHQKFTVKAALIAMGPQDVSVQARCGENVGPILNLRWYGVPDDYQALMVQDLSDGRGRHLFELVRDIDCAPEKRRFECSVGNEPYALCPNANQITNPEKGLKVRVSCDGLSGPPLTID